jgi:flavin reductase (DIM6/NTAB) family NADH-FMN oxidoreductase RutF
LLEDTLATIECRIVERYPGGDHTIFVGAVDTAATRDGLPLLYFTGQYGRLAHDRQPSLNPTSGA